MIFSCIQENFIFKVIRESLSDFCPGIIKEEFKICETGINFSPSKRERSLAVRLYSQWND